MFDAVKTFLEDIGWITILLSFFADLILLFTCIRAISKYVRRKGLYKIDLREKKLCALSIGLGRNDPYEAVIDYMGNENTGKIQKYYKYHQEDKEKDLSQLELEEGKRDIEAIIGELRRKHFKEVLIFYAGPVGGAAQIGYIFRNFMGTVKFMQWDRDKKQYEVMPITD